MVVPLWVNRDYLTTIDLYSAYWQISVSSQHMVKSLTLSPTMWVKVHHFLGDATPQNP